MAESFSGQPPYTVVLLPTSLYFVSWAFALVIRCYSYYKDHLKEQTRIMRKTLGWGELSHEYTDQ